MSDTTIRPEEPHLSTAEVERLVEPSSQPRATRWFNTVVRSREMSILLVLVVVVTAATIKTPSFLFSANSWRDLLLTPSILLLLAVGQTVVIITRNVDLSVGSVLAFTAYLTGRLFIDHPGIPIVAVVADRPRWPAPCSAWSTALLVAIGKVPGAGDHARHAVHLPRHRAHLGRQRPDQRQRPARRASSSSAPRRSCRSRCCSSSPRSWSASSATTCTPTAAAASSTPSAPTRTPPSSTA